MGRIALQLYMLVTGMLAFLFLITTLATGGSRVVPGAMTLFFFWTSRKAWKKLTSKPGDQQLYQTKSHSENSNFTWPPSGEFACNIVGEASYQNALKTLAGDHGKTSPQQIYRAAIIPENDNPHDSLAVRVDIDGRTVGYLSRANARSFRARLSKKRLSGETTSCSAKIFGGFTTSDGRDLFYGVRLDIPPLD